MIRNLLAALVAAALAACGASTSTPPAGQDPGASCRPACAGLACGDDGCGGSCGACGAGYACDAGACVKTVPPCTRACQGRACGDDGCGGTCGTCADGQTCTAQGACASQTSLNCPAGQRCTLDEYVAYAYTCTAPGACVQGAPIATYPSYEDCWSVGCEGGNSRCGDQFGGSTPEMWACEACIAACVPSGTTYCPQEVAGGCALGGEILPCLCR